MTTRAQSKLYKIAALLDEADAFHQGALDSVPTKEIRAILNEDEPPDALPQWLWLQHRFRHVTFPDDWDALSEVDKRYWQHEADVVRRAVERHGFTNLDAP